MLGKNRIAVLNRRQQGSKRLNNPAEVNGLFDGVFHNHAPDSQSLLPPVYREVFLMQLEIKYIGMT
ncbi:hypothetical protein [Halothermothrix orenii]|uniref:hypothetical protein n=1 Tax=Halothermothrix orenii TaxID=31909 RepID=UPI00030067D7|nr:hypothetical protein [Halothermothrix orenii]